MINIQEVQGASRWKRDPDPLHFSGLFNFMKSNPWVLYLVYWCSLSYVVVRFLLRMYWFPLKVLYSILPSTAKVYYDEHLPFGVEFNIMLWLLLGMDLYWFTVSFSNHQMDITDFNDKTRCLVPLESSFFYQIQKYETSEFWKMPTCLILWEWFTNGSR